MKPSTFSLLAFGTLTAVVAACAQGGTTDVNGTPLASATQTKDTTEPPPSSQLPGKGSSSGNTSSSSSSGDSSSGDTSSSSSSSSTSSSGSTSSGSTSGSSGTSSGTTSSGSSGTSSGSSGTSSGSTSGGTSSGSSGTPGCTTVAPSNACGLTPQCGCAANQTCDVSNKSTGAVSCVTAGTAAQGAPCTTSSQCGVGLTCAYGACRPYCATANAACTGAGLGQCGQYYDPPGTAVPNEKVCTIECDLRNPSAACGSNTCIWDSGVNASDCDKAGTKGLWASCTTYNDCLPGYACINFLGNECEPWCRVGHNEDCPASSTGCVDVFGATAPVQNGAKLGTCQ